MAIEKDSAQKNLRWLKITGITLAIIVVVGGLGYGGYYLFTRSRNISPAPDFSVLTITGFNFTLSDFQGKVVLIDFMDSVTCPPCRALMPELVAISEEFNDSLVIISVDILATDTAVVASFKEEFNATWHFALDSINLQEKYSVTQIPKTVIIDKEGYITLSETGYTAGSGLRDKVEETIEGTAERITASYGFSLSIAFIAGVLSFFSPCAFPLLPGYMAYNLDLMVKDEIRSQAKRKEKIEEESGEENENEEIEESSKYQLRKRVWKSFLWGSAAALGIAIFYMIIGLIAAFVGEVIGEWVEYVTPVVGGLLVILGIISLTPLQINMGFAVNGITKISKRVKRKRMERKAKRNKNYKYSEEEIEQLNDHELSHEAPQLLQLFLYGITYALASIGCNGPIILGLTLKSIETGAFVRAIMIFLVYSLAMALLMIIITILVGFSKDVLINKLQASTKFVKILSGILLILAGGFLIGYFFWNRYHIT